MGTDSREGPASDMVESGEVGEVGVGEERAGETERNLRYAVV